MEIYETNREIAKRKNWLLSLVIIVLVTVGVLVLLQGVSMALVPFLFGIEFQDIISLISGEYSIPNGRMALYFIQGIGSGVGFICSALLIAWAIDRASFGWKIQWSHFKFSKFLIALLLTGGAMLVNGLLIYWNAQMELPSFLQGMEEWMKAMEGEMMKMTLFLTDFQSTGELLAGLLVIGLLAGLGEELFFRGVLQPKLHRYTGSYHWGIWLTAAIFSAIHMQFYGFLPRLFLGAVFGYLYVYSGSLVYPILAHILNNSITLLLVYGANQGWVEFDIESTDSVSYPASLLGLLVLSGGILYFKQTKPELTKEESMDWIKVYESQQQIQAEIVKGVLEENSIPAVVLSKKETAYQVLGYYEVLVNKDHAIQASNLIKDGVSF